MKERDDMSGMICEFCGQWVRTDYERGNPVYETHETSVGQCPGSRRYTAFSLKISDKREQLYFWARKEFKDLSAKEVSGALDTFYATLRKKNTYNQFYGEARTECAEFIQGFYKPNVTFDNQNDVYRVDYQGCVYHFILNAKGWLEDQE